MLAAPLYSLLCSFHMHWSVTSCQSPFSLLAASADSGLRSSASRKELHAAQMWGHTSVGGWRGPFSLLEDNAEAGLWSKAAMEELHGMRRKGGDTSRSVGADGRS